MSKHLTINLDDEGLYEAFGVAAKALGSDKSKLIRDYVRGVVEADKVRREIVERNTAKAESLSMDEISEVITNGEFEVA